jgi:hypothetical protein
MAFLMPNGQYARAGQCIVTPKPDPDYVGTAEKVDVTYTAKIAVQFFTSQDRRETGEGAQVNGEWQPCRPLMREYRCEFSAPADEGLFGPVTVNRDRQYELLSWHPDFSGAKLV